MYLMKVNYPEFVGIKIITVVHKLVHYLIVLTFPKSLQGLALTGGFDELNENFFDEVSLLDNLVIFALSDCDYSMTMNGQDPYVQGSRVRNNFCNPGDDGCKMPVF